MSGAERCPACGGLVAGTRRVDQPTAWKHHLDSCPALLRVVKR